MSHLACLLLVGEGAAERGGGGCVETELANPSVYASHGSPRREGFCTTPATAAIAGTLAIAAFRVTLAVDTHTISVVLVASHVHERVAVF
ncbi:hypothetical protein DAEQUDRAFT_723525 [Daedalea quercina L-15889]|uniref:Secreted protein n=1 Tax=Daedalea quercina L-15889 TaxID=1314783 RepID=A0A165SFL7_9APHY|nr:hypothetical protein DAEQUDRAFT_723525 [Daedalea quercina L-15889]